MNDSIIYTILFIVIILLASFALLSFVGLITSIEEKPMKKGCESLGLTWSSHECYRKLTENTYEKVEIVKINDEFKIMMEKGGNNDC